MQVLEEKLAFQTYLDSCHFFTVLVTYIVCTIIREETQAKGMFPKCT